MSFHGSNDTTSAHVRNRLFPSEGESPRSDLPDPRRHTLGSNISPEASRHSWSSPEVEPKQGIETTFTRSSEEEYDDEDDSMDETSQTSAPRVRPKQSRYLCEADRHMILQRIDQGERQAELAREFGVTRAAICHINKNRAEILARSNRPDVHAAARHPKRRKAALLKQRQEHQRMTEVTPAVPPSVHRVRSHALAMHMTKLCQHHTTSAEFRATADRAIWILNEEALAYSTRDRETGSMWSSEETPTCAFVMNESGYPMVEAFRAIQPDRPIGSITLEYTRPRHHEEKPRVSVRKMCAPLGLRDHRIFLMDANCTTAASACVAIQSLLDVGASAVNIMFVSLMLNAVAAMEIAHAFPRVQMVTALVASDASDEMGNFFERYSNTTTIHHNARGSNVDL